jgi:murein DD-endopeptidase MepM/ murein hydrolase activator NlpD
MQARIFYIFLAFILSGCAVTNSPAPIVYHHKDDAITSTSDNIIDQDNAESPNIEVVGDDKNYVVPSEKPSDNSTKIIYHEVNIDETIEEIAQKYKQSKEEIATLNSLKKPYKLEEFQVLKIQVPVDFQETDKPSVKTVEKPKTVDFIQPLDGKIVSKFGEDTVYGKNKGINIEAKPGTKILASASGKIIYADYDATFGYLVIIKLDNQNIVTSYAHLEDIIVTKGSSIKQGDVVGYVGSSGKVKTPQLHFGIREGKIAKDPLNYVKY